MKNGESLKRYEIVAGSYVYKMEEAPTGAWTKYSDIKTCEVNNFILKKLNFDLSLENKKLQNKIKELEEQERNQSCPDCGWYKSS